MEPNSPDPKLDAPAISTFAVRVRDTSFSVLADPQSPEVDVVFVHGFTGHPRRTWTSTTTEDLDGERPPKLRRLWGYGPSIKTTEAKEVFWPQDLLPSILPKARIMTYGYDSSMKHRLRGSVSQNTILDLGRNLLTELESRRRTEPRRPLIFVAHSLGGIVTKECLRKSEGCQAYQNHLYDIYDSVSGIIFFGTPHRGADPQSLIRNISESIIRLAGFTINDSIIESLIPSSERLTELREEFGKMAHLKLWTIYSFQEQYGVGTLNGRKVVEDVSSSLDDFEIETKQHITGDHMQMCRFKASDDTEFEKVAAAFDHLIRKSSIRVSERTEAADTVASAEQRQDCIKSLVFEQIDSRLLNISRAHTNTCKWLLEESEYKEWLDSTKVAKHHGFLWIKGNPGVGKSTLMKYTYGHLKRTFKDSTITSYFFNARGTVLEKTTIGMYRSLASQLIDAVPELYDFLHPNFLAKSRFNDGRVEWDTHDIQDFLLEVIRMSPSRHFVFLVDALDESIEDEVRAMVEFFEDMSQEAYNCGTTINVCFSSRKFPYITIKYGKSLTIEERPGHKEDIAKYVYNKLKAGNDKAQIEEIRSEIMTRASGVFLWVVLVVQSLNKAFDHGKLEAVQDRLKEIPDKLHQLFMDMLKRDTDNMEDLVLLLQWVLFARRPLRPVELHFATMSLENSTVLKPWIWDSYQDQDIERSIISSSKGLVQISKAKDHIVQFIHESVRDFLLDGGLASLDSELSLSLIGASHDRLKKCCYRYLTADALQLESVFDSLPVAKTPESKQLRLSVSQKFPLIEYAVHKMFEHAEAGESHGVSQQSFLQQFCRENCTIMSTWIAYNNVFEKDQIRRYSPRAKLLYICAEKGFSSLVKSSLMNDSSRATDRGGERYRHALDAALHKSQVKVIETILDFGDDHGLDSTEHVVLIRRFLHQHELSEVLIERLSKVNVSDQRGSYPLGMVAGIGNRDWSQLLLDKGADIEAKDSNGKTALIIAASGCKEKVVKLLLDRGANIEAKDNNGSTALIRAAESRFEAVVKLLLERGAAIEAKDNYGQTALIRAAQDGDEAVVKLLLERGAAIEAKDNNGQTALIRAAQSRCEAVVKLLLERGADIEAKDDYGSTALIRAAQSRSEAVVKLLLERGADIEAKDNYGPTALIRAAQDGDEALVKLLLERGAAIEAKGNKGQTALIRAAQSRCEAVVKLLLERGADIEAKDDYGSTALIRAAQSRCEAVVKLLLERGADIEAKDDYGQTALFRAAVSRFEAVVKLLLERGADIEAKSNDESTALIRAAQDGDEALVKLLLEKGANKRGFAEQKARESGHEAVIALLRNY